VASSPIRIATADTALGHARAKAAVAGLSAKTTVETELIYPLDPLVALLAGECDLVVDDAENVPITLPSGLALGATLKRADARDALSATDDLTLASLPAGASVGVDSALREAQVRSRRQDLVVSRFTGDALEAKRAGGFDAVVVSVASLFRLNQLSAATDYLGIDGWPTAPGQGAIAILVRAGDEARVKALNHAASRTLVDAERGVQERLAGSGVAPLGAHAILDDGMLFLSARVYSSDGAERATSSHALYVSDSVSPAGELAERVATELLELGAAALR